MSDKNPYSYSLSPAYLFKYLKQIGSKIGALLRRNAIHQLKIRMYLVTQLRIHDLPQSLGSHEDCLLIEMYVLVVVIMQDYEVVDKGAKDVHDLLFPKGKRACPALAVHIFEVCFEVF